MEVTICRGGLSSHKKTRRWVSLIPPTKAKRAKRQDRRAGFGTTATGGFGVTPRRGFGSTFWIDYGSKGEFWARGERGELGATVGGSKKGWGVQNFELGGPRPGPRPGPVRTWGVQNFELGGPGPEFRLLAGPSRYVRSRGSYIKHRSKGKIASNRSLKPFLEEDT